MPKAWDAWLPDDSELHDDARAVKLLHRSEGHTRTYNASALAYETLDCILRHLAVSINYQRLIFRSAQVQLPLRWSLLNDIKAAGISEYLSYIACIPLSHTELRHIPLRTSSQSGTACIIGASHPPTRRLDSSLSR